MSFSVPDIPALDDAPLDARLRHKLDRKTVPHGALGRVGALACQIGRILGSTEPRLVEPQLVVFAADHGIVAHGVSAYPSDVTWQMVGNFLAGGAAVSVLARQHGISQTVVDCGVCHDFEPAPGLLVRKVACGTADSTQGAAMTDEQCLQALANGAQLLKELPGNVVLPGEMGIGNTSAATLLLAQFTGMDLADITGAGTGLDAMGVTHKVAVLRRALKANVSATEPLEVLAALGGLEIATMVGFVLQAAHERRVIVVDGFIASSAVLVASQLAPAVLQRCVFAHRSDERGHESLLKWLGVKPLIDLGMRVGEGSGALLAWPILESACRLLTEMASFESAGVSDKD